MPFVVDLCRVDSGSIYPLMKGLSTQLTIYMLYNRYCALLCDKAYCKSLKQEFRTKRNMLKTMKNDLSNEWDRWFGFIFGLSFIAFNMIPIDSGHSIKLHKPSPLAIEIHFHIAIDSSHSWNWHLSGPNHFAGLLFLLALSIRGHSWKCTNLRHSLLKSFSCCYRFKVIQSIAFNPFTQLISLLFSGFTSL